MVVSRQVQHVNAQICNKRRKRVTRVFQEKRLTVFLIFSVVLLFVLVPFGAKQTRRKCWNARSIERSDNSSIKLTRSTNFKVLVTHEALPLNTQGGDQHVYSWMRAMVDMGWDVTYIYYVANLPLATQREITLELRANNIRVFGPCPQHDHFLHRFLADENFDVIFENFWANFALFSFNLNFNKIIHEQKLKTKIVMVAHDDVSERTRQEGDSAAAADFAKLQKFLHHRVDLIATVNARMQQDLKNNLSPSVSCSKISTITFTFDYAYDGAEKEQMSAGTTAGWDARSGISFVAAHNLANLNSLRHLCQTIAPKIEGETVWLNVFGSVPLPNECEARGRVVHHGVASQKEVNSALSGSRWFVTPCLSSIGVSTKIVRSLSVGTPVISTPLCARGMPDNEDTSGFPVLVLELDEFARQFSKIFRDKVLWEKLRERAIPYYQKHFSKRAVMRQLSEIHQSIVAKPAFGVLSTETNKPASFALQESSRKRLMIMWDVSTEVSSSFSSLNNAKYLLDEKYFLLQDPATCEEMMSMKSVTPDVYVQWTWPVKLSRPKCCLENKCRLIYVVAWEMGQLPRFWTEFFARNVDVIWTLSEYNAKMFSSTNVAVERVRILPLGVDCSSDRAKVSQLQEITSQIPNASTVFLYVGGALPRKALDVVLQSWCEAFTSTTNAVLVMKITYAHGGDEILKDMERLSTSSSTCAKLIVARDFIENINSLYAIADVLVHPARAEGFGLTPLEALSHGLIVIYNEFGATSEFLSTEYAIKVTAFKEVCKAWPCKNKSFCVFPDEARSRWDVCEELHGEPFWYTPHAGSLTASLQAVHQNLKIYKERAQFGKEIACNYFSWSAIAKAMERELFRAHQHTMTVKSALATELWPDSSLDAIIGHWEWKRMQRPVV